jgi:hypothetical protein
MDTVASSLDPQLVLGYSNARLLYLGGPNAKLVEIFGHAGKVSIADGGLVAGARVNIATGVNNVGNSQVTIGSSTLSTVLLNGVNVVMNDQTGSKVQIGSKDMGVMYLRAATLYINDGNNSDYINNGNTIIGNDWGSGTVTIAGNTNIATNGGYTNIGTGATSGNIVIGNSTSSRYTLIASKGITLGRYLSDGGYVDIAAEANTTTGYTILGSGNLQNNYIRGRNVNINSDTNGDVKLCNGTGILYIYSPLRVSYNPIGITSSQHIGWSQKASFSGIQTAYDGGDRVYYYGYFSPGVYICNFSAIASRQTNRYKALFYWTTIQPVNYIVNTTGGGYIDDSENDNPNGYAGFIRITGTGIISFTTASYIGLIQCAFVPGNPIDYLGYVVRVTRIA